MSANPTFMYGPKDGALVPELLWALDNVELQERTKDGTFIHHYALNYDTKNYEYRGVTLERDEDE